jgi:hypothetical protein
MIVEEDRVISWSLLGKRHLKNVRTPTLKLVFERGIRSIELERKYLIPRD